MSQYKIKFLDQFTLKCCEEVLCKANIQQEAKDEYSRRIIEVDLPDGEYFSQLVRVQDGEEKRVDGTVEYALISKNHITSIH